MKTATKCLKEFSKDEQIIIGNEIKKICNSNEDFSKFMTEKFTSKELKKQPQKTQLRNGRDER